MASPTARRSLWHHRDFRLLWGGQAVSELGSQVSVLAIPLVAIDTLHASTFAVGVLTAMQTLPFLLVGLPVGAVVDRLPHRPVLIAADVGRALALASIPVAWAASILALPQLYVVSVVSGVLTVFFDVAYQSYLPTLVAVDQLVEGNAKLAAAQSGAQVTGPAVGGALVGAVGGATAVLADAVSFVVSFTSLVAIKSPEPRAEGTARRWGGLLADVKEGLRFVWHEARIRSIALSTATSNLFGTMGLAVLLLFLRRQLHLSPTRVGVLLALGSAGGVIGAVIAGRLAARLGVGRAILGAITVSGIGGLAYPLATRSTATVLLITGGLLISAGSVAYNVNQVSLRQALCPPRLQGRMNASVRFVIWGTMPIGGFVGGVLGTAVGLRTTLWIAGAGMTAAFVWIACSPVPSLRTMPSGAGPEDDQTTVRSSAK